MWLLYSRWQKSHAMWPVRQVLEGLPVSVADARLLVSYGDVFDVDPGDVLISAWRRLAWAFFLLSGSLEVAGPFDKQLLVPGESFGVAEILTDRHAVAPGSLVAAEPSIVLALPCRSLTALAATRDTFGQHVEALLAAADQCNARSGVWGQ